MKREDLAIKRDGQRMTVREYHALCPEKLELLGGELCLSLEERLDLLALLLFNVGIDQAVRLGSPQDWQAAVVILSATGEIDVNHVN